MEARSRLVVFCFLICIAFLLSDVDDVSPCLTRHMPRRLDTGRGNVMCHVPASLVTCHQPASHWSPALQLGL